MKKKTKKTNKEWIFFTIFFIVALLCIRFLFLLQILEPHFKIYKNESGERIEVERIPIAWNNKEGSCGSSDFTIINEKTDYGECGWFYIEQMTIEWLEENCGCIQIDCEYIFNASKRTQFNLSEPEKFTSKTYEGFIWFTTDARGDLMAEY